MRKQSIMITGCLIILLLISVSVYAGSKGSLQAPLPQLKKADSAPDSTDTLPLPEIKKIEPVPEVKTVKPEDLFTGRGIIDRMGTKDIVLNDEQFDIMPGAEFFSETGKPISQSAFQKGDHVGFRSNPDKFYEINALWKIKKVKK